MSEITDDYMRSMLGQSRSYTLAFLKEGPNRHMAGVEAIVWEHGRRNFQLRADGFVVDDPQERAAAGGEFAEPLDEGARAGTREHMLGERQLDAQHYPVVLLHCRQVSVTGDSATVALAVTLRGKESLLQVPMKWRRNGKVLQAEGELTFRQTDIGLQPYSLMLGALRVADDIHARFTLLARQQ